MAFELIMHKAGGRTDAMKPGHAALHRNGRCRFTTQDLAKAGIKGECFVLVDRDKKLIGIRKPNPDEAAATFKVGGKGHAREISLCAAFSAIGLSYKACAGRYAVHHKDNLIYIMPEVTVPAVAKRGK